MRFGNPDDFAIDADVEPDVVPPSAVWGSMCVWCRGEPLGRCDERYCFLATAASSFDWMSGHLDELWESGFEGLDDEAAFARLDSFLSPHRFDFLTNWGEQFDNWRGFVVCPPGEDLRVYYRRPDRSRSGARVTRRGFQAAADAFVAWFEGHEARLRLGEQ